MLENMADELVNAAIVTLGVCTHSLRKRNRPAAYCMDSSPASLDRGSSSEAEDDFGGESVPRVRHTERVIAPLFVQGVHLWPSTLSQSKERWPGVLEESPDILVPTMSTTSSTGATPPLTPLWGPQLELSGCLHLLHLVLRSLLDVVQKRKLLMCPPVVSPRLGHSVTMVNFGLSIWLTLSLAPGLSAWPVLGLAPDDHGSAPSLSTWMTLGLALVTALGRPLSSTWLGHLASHGSAAWCEWQSKCRHGGAIWQAWKVDQATMPSDRVSSNGGSSAVLRGSSSGSANGRVPSSDGSGAILGGKQIRERMLNLVQTLA
ncbi:hypothetical protein Nepgr_017326 [Nepenthes gracilis]|uniref:Uncharacterized protein n=1 Tax=Nepenthes gracilis TaxID=150966 RepID=A0AAD3SP80_NEPGR|nr:hypothetical protein Nepgr_017326 [Nepenthes gracilis]